MGFELVTVDDADVSFSLNHPSMAWLYDVMKRAGVLGDDQVTQPELPDGWDEETIEQVATFVEGSRDLTLALVEVGLEVDDDPRAMITALRQVVRDAPDDSKLEQYDAFEQRREAVVTKVGDSGKVPAYKFESQDGWMVTADECKALVADLRQALEDKGAELYPPEPPQNVLMKEFERICAELQADPDPGELPEADEAREWLEDWIGFNEEAGALGGYRVY